MADTSKAVALAAAIPVRAPSALEPDTARMYEALAVRYARSELSPSWARGKPDNVFIAMVNGHALGLHPATAVNQGFVVNGHYDVYGATYLAIAQSRDPAFQYTIDEWSDDKITLTGWREGSEVRKQIKLLRSDLAKNPATAKNPSFASNPRDHLLWKASKRLVLIVTPGVMIGAALPREEEIEREPEAPKTPSMADVLEEAALDIVKVIADQKAAEPEAIPPSDDEVPPPVEKPKKKAAAPGGLEAFKSQVLVARKLMGREFLKEAPKGSGKWWYVDQATFVELGYETSIKVAEGMTALEKPGGVAVMDDAALSALGVVLKAACDEKERTR